MRDPRRNPLAADTALLDRVSLTNYERDLAVATEATQSRWADENRFSKTPADRALSQEDVTEPPLPADNPTSPPKAAPAAAPTPTPMPAFQRPMPPPAAAPLPPGEVPTPTPAPRAPPPAGVPAPVATRPGPSS